MNVRANRFGWIAVLLALLGATLATSTAAAGAQEAAPARCGSTFFRLDLQDFPATKRVMIRQGNQQASTWVTTIQGSPTEWEKPTPSLRDDFIVRVVPADGSPRFDVTCLRPVPISELPFTGPACTVELDGDIDLRFFGIRDTRPQLRSVQNGWVAGIDDSYRVDIDSDTIRTSKNTQPITLGEPLVFNRSETKANTKFDLTDDFFIRVRPNGVRSDIACEAPPTSTESFFASPDLAPPIPDDVNAEQPGFSAQFAGDLGLIEILDKTTGQLTILDVSDDYKNPRLSPDGSVLWMLDQEEQQELRIDLNSRIVTRRPR